MLNQHSVDLFAPQIEIAKRIPRPGMYHFAGTGPDGATCSECSSYTQDRQCWRYLEAVPGPNRKKPCVSKCAPACKYFEAR